MTHFCLSCGSPLPSGALRCSKCGTAAKPSAGAASGSPFGTKPPAPTSPMPTLSGTSYPAPAQRSYPDLPPPASDSFLLRSISPGGWFWWARQIDRTLGKIVWSVFLLFLLIALIWNLLVPHPATKPTTAAPLLSASRAQSDAAPSTTQAAPPAANADFSATALSSTSQQITAYVNKLRQNLDAKQAITDEFNTYLDQVNKKEFRSAEETAAFLSVFQRDLSLYDNRIQTVTTPFFQQPYPPRCQKLRDIYLEYIRVELTYGQQQAEGVQRLRQNTAVGFSGLDDMQWKQMAARQTQLVNDMEKEINRLADQNF